MSQPSNFIDYQETYHHFHRHYVLRSRLWLSLLSFSFHLPPFLPPNMHVFNESSYITWSLCNLLINKTMHCCSLCNYSYFLVGFFFSCTPSTLDNLPRIWGLGIALPVSYSLMTCGFSLTSCASWAWVNFLARRACWICFLSSEETRSCSKTSVSFSSLWAALTGPPAFLLPAVCFFRVSTAAPIDT